MNVQIKNRKINNYPPRVCLDFGFEGICEKVFPNSEVTYAFLHQNPFAPKRASGINYYRLKMKDLAGSFEYSEIRSIDFPSFQNLESLVTIYPNPTSDILNIRFLENVEEGRIEMYNELGQMVLEAQLNHPFNKKISVGVLPAGIYFLRLKMDGKNYTSSVRIH